MACYSKYIALFQLILISLCAAQATTFDPVSKSSLSSAQSTDCVSAINQYPPTIASYASSICYLCQGLAISPSIEPCCSASNPTACFASSFYGVSVSDATISSTIDNPPALSSCFAAIGVSTSCEQASPGFGNLCFHDQQSCYCSTSGTFAPSYYDDFWSKCLAYLSTAFPSSYSKIGPNENGVVQSRPCQTWNQLTLTEGTPSNCMTSAAASLGSPSSLAPVTHDSVSTTRESSGQSITTTTTTTTSVGVMNKGFHFSVSPPIA